MNPEPRDGGVSNGHATEPHESTTPSQKQSIVPRLASLGQRRATDFEVLPDGSLLDVIHPIGAEPSATSFLIWDGESPRILEHFEDEERVLFPPSLAEFEDFDVQLPALVRECGAAHELFLEIAGLIKSHLDISEEFSYVIAAFVLSTWLTGLFNVAPYLYVCGPQESGKTTLLRLLRCLCRRAVLFAGGLPTAVHRLNATFHPTLLLDEAKLDHSSQGRTLQSYLCSGNFRGVPVTLGGRLVDAFGPKVVCSRLPVADPALVNRGLHVFMVPSIRKAEVFSDDHLKSIADDFQPRLMMYRLLRYNQGGQKARSFERPTLGCQRLHTLTAMMQVAVLGATQRDNNWEVAASRLQAALNAQGDALRAERNKDVVAMTAKALLDCCHEKELPPFVLVGSIAAHINDARTLAGEGPAIRPRAVGEIVRSLGFRTRTRNGYGRGIELNPAVIRAIHELSFNFRNSVSGPETCKYCIEAKALVAQIQADGSKKASAQSSSTSSTSS